MGVALFFRPVSTENWLFSVLPCFLFLQGGTLPDLDFTTHPSVSLKEAGGGEFSSCRVNQIGLSLVVSFITRSFGSVLGFGGFRQPDPTSQPWIHKLLGLLPFSSDPV